MMEQNWVALAEARDKLNHLQSVKQNRKNGEKTTDLEGLGLMKIHFKKYVATYCLEELLRTKYSYMC